ncbi:hypothetical protein [Helicobacter mesocricetorum]|uniref:hypothetical protein n=1 Tax=Helicobacter mesocricetorum TaxID=87012 RepID=UPI001F36D7EB|nr:hypothetical protein [Helicobacter mesocricetorum]
MNHLIILPQNQGSMAKKGNLHTNFDHKMLCENLKQTNHKFLLTYDDSQIIRNLYKDFYILEWSLQYGMNNYKQEKANIGKELLISNFNLLQKNCLFSMR